MRNLIAGTSFSDGRVHLLPGQLFSILTLWLAKPGQLGQGEAIRAWEVDHFSRDNFSSYKRGLRFMFLYKARGDNSHFISFPLGVEKLYFKASLS